MLHLERASLARQVVHEYVHDPDAFTQGLEYDTDCTSGACKEVFWESTGAFAALSLSKCCLHPLVRADACLKGLWCV